PHFACAPTSNPTARPDSPPTSPPSPRPNCGWYRGSVCTSRSRRRKSTFTPSRNGAGTDADQLDEPRVHPAGTSSCQQLSDMTLACSFDLAATSQLNTI